MKPRSIVAAWLAITETLLAARAKAARMKQAPVGQRARRAKLPRTAKSEGRPLPLRIKAQASF